LAGNAVEVIEEFAKHAEIIAARRQLPDRPQDAMQGLHRSRAPSLASRNVIETQGALAARP
jgi:hypothetical protein